MKTAFKRTTDIRKYSTSAKNTQLRFSTHFCNGINTVSWLSQNLLCSHRASLVSAQISSVKSVGSHRIREGVWVRLRTCCVVTLVVWCWWRSEVKGDHRPELIDDPRCVNTCSPRARARAHTHTICYLFDCLSHLRIICLRWETSRLVFVNMSQGSQDRKEFLFFRNVLHIEQLLSSHRVCVRVCMYSILFFPRCEIM